MGNVTATGRLSSRLSQLLLDSVVGEEEDVDVVAVEDEDDDDGPAIRGDLYRS